MLRDKPDPAEPFPSLRALADGGEEQPLLAGVSGRNKSRTPSPRLLKTTCAPRRKRDGLEAETERGILSPARKDLEESHVTLDGTTGGS